MDVETVAEDTPDTTDTRLSRKGYLRGVGLLLIVVFLWTLSSFITQDLFEGGYEKPFMVTYLNTSSFALYLVPWAYRSIMLRRAEHANDHSRQGYETVAVVDTVEAPVSALISNFRAPSLVSEDVRSSEELEPLTTGETAKLASVFCLLWFIANWSVNASLELTSVASSTILSSTSGFFTLIVGRVFKIEMLTVAKILAVMISFIGVALVSASDSTSAISDGPSILGDVLALLSAIFYALYVILLKVTIKDESRIDMQLFFGFVGLFNVLILWPIAVVLHLTGAEPFLIPPSGKAWTALLFNMLITLSSDYIYVLAMLKTSPLLVTIGLSLTIPLAILGDRFLNIPTAPQAAVGAILVLGAFVFVGVENQKEAIQQKSRSDGNFEVEEVGTVFDAGPHT